MIPFFIVPALNFAPKEDAQALYKAMKGIGTDEKTLINILANRCLKQRRELNRAYNFMYGKKGDTLDKKLHSETSGEFRTALLTLLENFGTIDAQSIKNSLKNKDIKQIVMTLGTRTSKQIGEMLESYNNLYRSNLMSDIKVAFSEPEDFTLVEFLGSLIKAQNRTISTGVGGFSHFALGSSFLRVFS